MRRAGSNEYGQLGEGGMETTSLPVPIKVRTFASRSVLRALFMSQAHTGSLYRCGKST